MLAKQISRDQEVFCTADMPLTEIYRKMMELSCSCMPIVESPKHKNIIGVITEHDICEKLINGGLNPQRTSAGRVMNGKFTTVSGETCLEECAELIKSPGIERLFVVDENGAFLGILTETDFVIPEKPSVTLETVITDFAVAPPLPAKIQLGH